MSLEGKNRALFSYNCMERSNRKFMYKDYEKANPYHSYFAQSDFSYTSLRAAKMKYCNFAGCTFVETEFIGTNLRGSSFRGASFNGAIFNSVVLDRTDFTNATFQNCYFLGVSFNKASNAPKSLEGNTVFSAMPSIDDFSPQLLTVVESLRRNDIIRRSNTLHLKRGRINTLTLYILGESFSETELVEKLAKLPPYLTTQFHTVSYLKKMLKKIE